MWSDAFVQSRAAAGRSPATLAYYRQILGQFERYAKAQGTDKVTTELVTGYLASLNGRQGSRAAHGRAIRAWANWSGLDLQVTWPRPPRPAPDAHSNSDVARILAACQCQRDRALVTFLTEVGLRRSELLAMDWHDVDWAGRRLVVRVSKSGPRIVAIPSRSLEALQSIQQPGGAVWRTAGTSQRLTAPGLRQVMRRLSVRTGLHITPHKFRRTAATRLANHGASVPLLMAQLGWSSPAMAVFYCVPDLDRISAIQESAWT